MTKKTHVGGDPLLLGGKDRWRDPLPYILDENYYVELGKDDFIQFSQPSCEELGGHHPGRIKDVTFCESCGKTLLLHGELN